MPDQSFIYIDGESHYIRSEKAWQKIHGDQACLDCLRFRGEADDRLILVNPKAHVFWTKRMNPNAKRAIYFTSAAGDTNALHEIEVSLRNFGLDPFVIHEDKQLFKNRAATLNKYQVIEKPKGVDIRLAVRMLEDAQCNAFDVCHLYTSDVDFLPVIEAVRARGKQVYVHGYADELSHGSPMLTKPDQFADLEEMLRTQCDLVVPK